MDKQQPLDDRQPWDDKKQPLDDKVMMDLLHGIHNVVKELHDLPDVVKELQNQVAAMRNEVAAMKNEVVAMSLRFEEVPPPPPPQMVPSPASVEASTARPPPTPPPPLPRKLISVEEPMPSGASSDEFLGCQHHCQHKELDPSFCTTIEAHASRLNEDLEELWTFDQRLGSRNVDPEDHLWNTLKNIPTKFVFLAHKNKTMTMCCAECGQGLHFDFQQLGQSIRTEEVLNNIRMQFQLFSKSTKKWTSTKGCTMERHYPGTCIAKIDKAFNS